ncbi:MAG: bifunctional DNA-formamidopyrimidine glycosylase/DNA-(apurinic or apyrimidinic site) lyase [Candidatus Falkowbacteria bacterium]
MPELPEVETVVRDLRTELDGQRFRAIDIIAPKSVHGSQRQIEEALVGKKLKAVGRIGKSLYLDFGDYCLYIHLKMTGQLVWQHKRQIMAGGHPIINVGSELPNKYTRAVLYFSNSHSLYFNDVRRFGWIKLVDQAMLETARQKYGRDPLDPGFSGAVLAALLKGKQKSIIKAAIMDQSKLAGVGNIYADEALFASRLMPDRLVSTLSPTDWSALAKAIKAVLLLSIKHRGTSFSDYRDGRGEKGNFVNFLKVYGRKNADCLKCGTALIKTRLAGRGAIYCPHCQK